MNCDEFVVLKDGYFFPTLNSKDPIQLGDQFTRGLTYGVVAVEMARISDVTLRVTKVWPHIMWMMAKVMMLKPGLTRTFLLGRVLLLVLDKTTQVEDSLIRPSPQFVESASFVDRLDHGLGLG